MSPSSICCRILTPGFEALIGYLYLNHEYERLTELVSIGLKSMDEEMEQKE